MASAPADAIPLSAARREVAFPQEALSFLLPLLPLDDRARAACVNRPWRAAAAHPSLWKHLSFEGCAAQVNDTTLAQLCARAGAALRTLDLDASVCDDVTCAGLLVALRDGGCSGLRWLGAPATSWPWLSRLSVVEAQQLAAACPALQHAACKVRCYQPDVAAAATALPGPLALYCEPSHEADFAQIVECLRVNATLTSLFLQGGHLIGDKGVAQLADSLRINTTLKNLDLSVNDISAVGVVQLVHCLRVNNTLTSLNLNRNYIRDDGATHLAEFLRVNTTLTSLDLSYNEIGAAGVTRLAECLRVNTTLMHLGLGRSHDQILDAEAAQLADCLRVNTTLRSLDLQCNNIGVAAAVHLLECQRVNATLTSLNLNANDIGYAGAAQLAQCLRAGTTLTELHLWGNGFSDLDESKRLLRAACPPQCKLIL